ncbi:OB-fold domain-containing protein [Actinomadura sp. 7K507]|uniref:thiolase C-terminal domain-containing protein n=1 Tax=Actinomadura sp. 7K507 TaxID=2530365 RepID=UPI00104B5354|nr:OB-fold domain-containing protein [Actinomadura sp. 7K507]TDC85094.1 3-ketoacyl-CoA thiolase [Actinomadura sp. 7K507]
MKRPLPLVTPWNEFYWTSGADGRLRVQECGSCSALVHPPKPFCPHCQGSGIGIKETSGFGTLFGFTVSHRFQLPGLPAPYVIAQVALEDDPRVKLTTRLVDCAEDDLRLGMRMEVTFEQVEDVWLPLFRPAADQPERPAPLPEDEVTPQRIRAMVRPPARPGRKFEDDAVLSGIGRSAMGRRLMTDPLALTVEACRAAVEDAGLTMDDIDGLSTYPGGGLEHGMGEGGVTALEAVLRVRPSWFNGGGETFGPGGSVIAAMLAVSAGLARHVLCFRTVWQSSHDLLLREGRFRAGGGGGRIGGDMGWAVPFGATSAAHTLAQTAQRYFHRYGATRETLGWVALNQRANAALDPTAVYSDPMTMDDYLNARMITTPFGLYDCDVPVDASVAVVVSAAETAGDLRVRPVRVEAAGTQIVERLEWDQSTSTHEPQVFGPAAHLWTRTTLRPDDVDVAQLYDGFSFNCLSWIEALGFCGIGEGKDFLDGGKNIARDGVLPLNTHGGQLSHGRTHGMGLVHEAVAQLRGDAGARQIDGARVAVVSSGGLTPSGVMLLRADA